MPNLNKTGPQGKGPKTGRGLGKCQDKKQSADNLPQNSRKGNRQKLNRRGVSCSRKNQKNQ